MTGFVLPTPQGVASATLSPAACFMVGVGLVESMTADAMRRGGIPSRRRHAAHDVLTIRDGLQMRWIDASSDTTPMVQHQPDGYWTNRRFVGEPMGIDHAMWGSEVSVALDADVGRPDPALAGLVDLRPEALVWRGDAPSSQSTSVQSFDPTHGAIVSHMIGQNMTDPAEPHDDPELVDVTTLPDDVPDGEVDTNDE